MRYICRRQTRARTYGSVAASVAGRHHPGHRACVWLDLAQFRPAAGDWRDGRRNRARPDRLWRNFSRVSCNALARESLPALGALSQLGLVLFMFIVGAEMRAPNGVRAQVKAAGAVGVLSVLLPMALGVAIAPALHPRFAPEGVSFWPFALFMAAAMAITAFPVMARILKERNMTHTTIGRLSLS